MTRIALMANGWPGREVANWLHREGEEIVALYLDDPSEPMSRDTVAAAGVPAERVFPAGSLKEPTHRAELAAWQIDFIITVYWPYLLAPEVFGAAHRGTVNFHPALLPVNRGWYPHVHSILDGSPTGVTLHAIDAGTDTGPIWAQRPVPLLLHDTAKTIYDRLQQDIVELFKESWPGIRNGALVPVPQDNTQAIYHSKKEIVHFDYIDTNHSIKARDLINILRARSFGNKGFAYIEEGGERVYLNLRLSRTQDFSE